MKVEFTPEFEKSLKRLVWSERTRYINPKQWYREVKWFIQRGRRGYSDRDLWNTNDYIARAVLAFFEHTEECILEGYPTGLTDKRWDKYKAEIKWLMEQELAEIGDVPTEVLASEAYQKRRKKARRIFGEYWDTLWD